MHESGAHAARRNEMRKTAALPGALVLLLFTGVQEVRADERQWPRPGPVVRLGTAVGFSEIGERSVSTLGGQVALGYRIGPVILDAEYERLAMLTYLEDEYHNANRGRLHRIGVSGRIFLLRIGGRVRDPSSSLRLYLEGGAGRQSGRWSTGEDFDRNDVSVGAGWLLDFKDAPPRIGLPFHSFGWHFGWRVTAARADGEDVVFLESCPGGKGGKGCDAPPMPGHDTDLGLIVVCAMTAAW
jgi:hypothetical protein